MLDETIVHMFILPERDTRWDSFPIFQPSSILVLLFLFGCWVDINLPAFLPSGSVCGVNRQVLLIPIRRGLLALQGINSF